MTVTDEEESGKSAFLSFGRVKMIPDMKEARDSAELSRNDGSWLQITDRLNDATDNEEYGLTAPTHYQRWFAVKYLPIAWKITFGIAADCFKSGEEFPYNFGQFQTAGGEFEPAKWSDDALRVMRDTNFFRTLQKACGIGRMDGESVIILMEEGFDWEGKLCEEERDYGVPIVDTLTLPMFYVNQGATYTRNEYMKNGMPRFWYVRLNSIDNRGHPFTTYKKIHHSRIIHHNPDPLDTSTTGMCVLDRCWQAITIGWNIDIGTGEAFFRWGIGHPTMMTDTEDIEDLNDVMSGLGAPTRRTWHAFTKHVTEFKLVGAQGQMLDVHAGKEHAVYDEVAMGAAIPRPILKGEVAGVLTGSEVNERNYFATLRQVQQALNDPVWIFLAIINESNNLGIDGVKIIEHEPLRIEITAGMITSWAVHYVETERERIDKLLQKVNILGAMSNFLRINETRRFAIDLLNMPKDAWPDLPEEIGGQILAIYESPYESAIGGNGSGSKRVCKRCGNVFSPHGDEKICPKCANVSKPKSGEPAEHGNKLKKREDPIHPNITQQTGDKFNGGCMRHATYSKMCPDCVEWVRARENLARVYLSRGYSGDEIRRFLHLSRNAVTEIQKDIDKEERNK